MTSNPFFVYIFLNYQGAGFSDGGQLRGREHEGGRRGVQAGGPKAQTCLLCTGCQVKASPNPVIFMDILNQFV